MRTLAGVGIIAAGMLAATDAAAPTPPPAPVAERFLSRIEAGPSSYRAVRRLTAANEKRKMSGWIEATTQLDAISGFSYQITAEGGSGYIRSKVLKRVLEAEREMHLRPAHARAALNRDNYVFGDASEDAGGLLLVPIAPKRRSELLVNGFIVLDRDADLVRVDGRLSKNPSFWTRQVDVVRRYGRANGVRVPLQMSSEAHVLIVGLSTFSMCIDYEAINGEPVFPRTSCS